MITMVSRVWFITGASSGFGRSMTELALERGDAVVATLRQPDVLSELRKRYTGNRLLILKVDVRNEEEISDAFDKTREVFGRLDIVYNNAGVPLLGEFEAVPETTARDVMEINFWGVVNVTKHALRFFREVNEPGIGGRILQMSSLAGISGRGMSSYYSASKHALEAISDSISQELKPEWNIKITVIEPGAFPTNALLSIPYLPVHPAYDYPTSPHYAARAYLARMKPGTNVDKANKTILDLVEQPNPPARVMLGSDVIGTAKNRAAHLLEVAEKSTEYDVKDDI